MKLLLLTNTSSKKKQQEKGKTTLHQSDHELLLIIQVVSCYRNLSCLVTLNCPFLPDCLTYASIARLGYQLQMSLKQITIFIPYQLRQLQ